MKAVVRAILLDPEARGNVKTDPNYGKLREPVQLMTNFLKHLMFVRLTVNAERRVIDDIAAGNGQNAFYAPTVFNYYSPDYIIPGTTLNGPEFGLMTTGTAIGRANFVNNLLFSHDSMSIARIPERNCNRFNGDDSTCAGDPTGNQLLDALNTK